VTSLEDRKAAARKAAFARRKLAFDAGQGGAGHLSEVLAGYRGVPLAGYMPMRTEIDPLPAMEEASAHGPVGGWKRPAPTGQWVFRLLGGMANRWSFTAGRPVVR